MRITIAAIFVLALAASVVAQTAKPAPTPPPAKPNVKPPDTIALTEQEAARGQQLREAEKEAGQIVNAAAQAAANAPIAAQSATEAVGQLKAASLQFQVMQLQRQLWELRVRIDHDCAKCGLSEDRKSLIRSPEPEARLPPKK